MILTIIIAAFAACGIILVLRSLFDAVRLPLPERDIFQVFFISGDPANAEQIVRNCLRFRDRKGLYGKLIFVDDGLLPEAKKTIELLLRFQPAAVLCSKEALLDYIRRENDRIGTGTD